MASPDDFAYTPAQISAYLEFVSFHRPETPAGADLDYLRALQARQLARVPFENLSLHYSAHHGVTLDAAALFAKIVERGRGGYCMETNAFFARMLAGLGYDVYTAGARVSRSLGEGDGGAAAAAAAERFGGWSHMVSLVRVSGTLHLVDVGFGAGGSLRPMPLVDGAESAGLGPQVLRVRHRRLAQHRDASQRAWVLESRADATTSARPPGVWTPLYAFTTDEFFPADYAVMNRSTSAARDVWFTYTVVCVRMLLAGEVDEATGSESGNGAEDGVVGRLTLVDRTLKRNVRGTQNVVLTCANEAQRLDVLEKYFRVVLSDEERRGIRGLVTELR